MVWLHRASTHIWRADDWSQSLNISTAVKQARRQLLRLSRAENISHVLGKGKKINPTYLSLQADDAAIKHDCISFLVDGNNKFTINNCHHLLVLFSHIHLKCNFDAKSVNMWTAAPRGNKTYGIECLKHEQKCLKQKKIVVIDAVTTVQPIDPMSQVQRSLQQKKGNDWCVHLSFGLTSVSASCPVSHIAHIQSHFPPPSACPLAVGMVVSSQTLSCYCDWSSDMTSSCSGLQQHLLLYHLQIRGQHFIRILW